jgi:hypothetical protein
LRSIGFWIAASRAHNSARLERTPDKGEVDGSNPSGPTHQISWSAAVSCVVDKTLGLAGAAERQHVKALASQWSVGQETSGSARNVGTSVEPPSRRRVRPCRGLPRRVGTIDLTLIRGRTSQRPRFENRIVRVL